MKRLLRLSVLLFPVGCLTFLSLLQGQAAAESKIRFVESFGNGGVVRVYVGLGETPQVAVDKGGRFLASAGEFLSRFDSTGSIDVDYGFRGRVALGPSGSGYTRVAGELIVDRRGRALIARTIFGDIRDRGEVRRVTPQGKVDLRFGEFGVLGFRQYFFGEGGTAAAVALTPSQEILFGGNGVTYQGKTVALAAKARRDGRPARRFGQRGAVRISDQKAGARRLLVTVAGIKTLRGGGAIVAAYLGDRLRFTMIDRDGRLLPRFGGRGTGSLTLPTKGLKYLPTTVGLPALAASNGLAATNDGSRFYFLERDTDGFSRVIAFTRSGQLIRNFGRGGVATIGGPNSFRGVALTVLPSGVLAVGGAITPARGTRNVGAIGLIDQSGQLLRGVGKRGFRKLGGRFGWVTDLVPVGGKRLLVGGSNDFGRRSNFKAVLGLASVRD